MLWQEALPDEGAARHAGARALRAQRRSSALTSPDAVMRAVAVVDTSRAAGEQHCSDDDDDSQEVVEGRRLWDASIVYPSGVSRWEDARNCAAALAYDCPCGQRCLSKVGDVIQLYNFRRSFRAEVSRKGSGGIRDVLRKSLEKHFDRALGVFTNSFVVGDCGGVCERAYAVACSVSEPTFVRARADVTQQRGWHEDRALVRNERESKERKQLEAWVRLQREHLEGDKCGTKERWFTERETEKTLWKKYVAACDAACQCTVGSSRLLHKIWKEHKEYKEVPPTGHAICDTCGMLASERASLEGLVDAASAKQREKIAAKEVAHQAFHRQERRHYETAVERARLMPHDVTTITIDSPTMHQFDLPSQARSRRDTVKKLDGQHRWQSKLEGVLDAGSAPHTLPPLGPGPANDCTTT